VSTELNAAGARRSLHLSYSRTCFSVYQAV